MDNKINASENHNMTFEQGEKLPQENLLHILLWHRWTIFLTVVIFLSAAIMYLVRATPIYLSDSRLYVEQSGPKIINDYEGIMTRSNNYLYTQGELIKSTPIISEVANNDQIKRLKTFSGIDNIVGYLKSSIKVDIGRKDDIITVSCKSPYPDEAAQIINSIVESYVSYHSSSKKNSVFEVLKILQKEKTKRDEELSNTFAKLLQFTRENGAISLENNSGNVIMERLNKLSSALTETQLMALNAKADYEAVKNMTDNPEKIRQFAGASAGSEVFVFGNDRETQLRNELRDAELEKENILYYCTEDHPSVQAIKTKINHIKQELNDQNRQFADAYIEVAQLRWETAKQREEELENSFKSQQENAQELGVKAAEYAVLQSELKRAERLCEILDNRIKDLNVTEDTGALNINILEVARPAVNPSEPQKTRILTMALTMGLAFGVCLAFLRNWMDYRLHSSEEITALLNVPVLGEVPSMSGSHQIELEGGNKFITKLKSFLAENFQAVRNKYFTYSRSSRTILKKQNLMAQAKTYRAMRASNGLKVNPVIISASVPKKEKTNSEFYSIQHRGQIVRLRPKSIIAEAYRTIRTSVFFGAARGGAKTILVTSPAPGDGKTTLVSNLAIAIAQAGQRTLVIDADLRKPKQHKIFGINSEPGLANVLIGETRLDDAIKTGPVKGLDILSCGTQVPNPSEILNNENFAQTLENLMKCYDRIIIDSPPVVPVADSQIIAARCDIVLLVVRADKSTRKISQQARHNIVSVGGNLLGVIVNDVANKRSHYGYYGRYQSSYGYGGYGGYGYSGYYSEDVNARDKQEYEEKVCI